MKLSVVIPVHNEEDAVQETIVDIVDTLSCEGIEYEIVVVNDSSSDRTPEILDQLSRKNGNIHVIHRDPPNGFGRAVQDGLRHITGDMVVIVMGDASDDPRDIITYARKIEEGYDCVFGSRFVSGTRVADYPFLKLFINRLANLFIQCLFLIRYNDMTNAFKAYKREVIEAIQPLQAHFFNITVELPLKAVVRNYRYAVVPINWYGRKSGVSKLKLREMGRKYLFTVLYVWLEKMLIKDEFNLKTPRVESAPVLDPIESKNKDHQRAS